MQVSKSLREGHVAAFGFLGASHTFALFNLVCKSARAAPDVQFSFFGTAKWNYFILSTQNINLPINIKAYNVDDGVPKGYDLAKNPSKELEFFVSAASENFKCGMDEAVRETGRRISCLVTDAMLSFVAGKMAKDMNVPWLSFWVPAPYDLSAQFHMDLIRQLYSNVDQVQKENQTLEIIPGLSAIRIADLPAGILPSDDPIGICVSSMTQKFGEMLPQAFAVVMNSYKELNPTLLTNDLKSKFQNLLYVGCLSLPEVPPPLLLTSDADVTGCLSWLDRQKSASVVYISFGSVVVLASEELVALAEALEASGVPFLWSLKDNLKEQLPDGFLERVSVHGKAVPWTPQSQVLAHTSIGVHVTHCGYNSIFESVLGAVPMICRSVFADNHMNARMVEEVWEIGVRIEGGVITKSGMLKSLEVIFQHEKGKKMREAISALKEVVLKAAAPDGNAAKDFKTFVQIISEV